MALPTELTMLSVNGDAHPDEQSPYVSLALVDEVECPSLGEPEHYVALARPDGRPWELLRSEEDRRAANFQGNPLWPSRALMRYPHLADHFGLRCSASDNILLIPTWETINHKLRRLHAASGVGSLFTFRPTDRYPCPDSGGPTDHAYIDAFVNDRVLPVADRHHRDSVHDWSYHFFSLLVPDFLERVRASMEVVCRQLGRFAGTTRYPWNYFGHTVDEAGRLVGRRVVEELPYVDALYRQMAVSLDVASGKLVQVVLLADEGRFELVQDSLEPTGTYLTGPSAESVETVLYLEVGLPQKLDLPDSEPALSPSEALASLHRMLARLDLAAAELNDQQDLARRARFLGDVHRRLAR